MSKLLLATVAIGALAFSGQAFAGASGSVAASGGGTFTGAIGFATRRLPIRSAVRSISVATVAPCRRRDR